MHATCFITKRCKLVHVLLNIIIIIVIIYFIFYFILFFLQILDLSYLIQLIPINVTNPVSG